MCHGDDPKASLTWQLNYIRTVIVPDNEKNQALAAIYSQTYQAKNTLKYYKDFYLQTFKITSLFHLRHYSLYVFVQVDTVSTRTQSGCHNYQWSNTILQCAALNPCLPSTFILRSPYRYQVRLWVVHHYRVISLRRILRRATLDRWGGVVGSY